MADPVDPGPRPTDRAGGAAALRAVATHEADRIERECAEQLLAGEAAARRADPLMGETAAVRDPDTGAAGTTNPRSAAPAGSSGPVGVVPPKRGEGTWLAIVGIGVVGVILILLLLT